MIRHALSLAYKPDRYFSFILGRETRPNIKEKIAVWLRETTHALTYVTVNQPMNKPNIWVGPAIDFLL